LSVATAGDASGHTTVAADDSPSASAPVCALAWGAGASIIDGAVSPSCALRWTSRSFVAVTNCAGFGWTARNLACGDGAASPGLTDIGAPPGEAMGPDGTGIECEGVADSIVAGAAAC